MSSSKAVPNNAAIAEDISISDGSNFISSAPAASCVAIGQVTLGPSNKKPFVIVVEDGWIDDKTKKFMENSGIASIDVGGKVTIDFMSVIKRLEHIERVLEEKADWFQVDPPTVKKD